AGELLGVCADTDTMFSAIHGNHDKIHVGGSDYASTIDSVFNLNYQKRGLIDTSKFNYDAHDSLVYSEMKYFKDRPLMAGESQPGLAFRRTTPIVNYVRPTCGVFIGKTFIPFV